MPTNPTPTQQGKTLPERAWIKALSTGDLAAYRTDIRSEHHDGRPVEEYVRAADAGPRLDLELLPFEIAERLPEIGGKLGELAAMCKSHVATFIQKVITTAATSSPAPAESDESWEATLAEYRQQINAMESATAPPERTRVAGGTKETRNRDEAQEIVLATEAALGEKFDSIARHELVKRITAALSAAAPADNDANNCTCDDLTEVQQAQGDHYDDCPRTTKGDR